MDELRTDTKREIIKLVFPDLRYGGDPDVEKYFELRRDGRLAQALSIYNGALRVRYPDDAARVRLLTFYRERDPRYSAYQEELLLAFADVLARRIARNIEIVTAPLEKADLSDALHALKAVESVLARIPGGPDAALALLTRYSGFARALRYREKLVQRAVELVREYDAVSRADSPADYDFVARSAAIEERRRASTRSVSAAMREDQGYDFVARSAELEKRRKSSEKPAAGFFDPERIKFSAAERARVEISPNLSRREDKVLAFCAKYWPYAADAAFERTVFLYSRKYGTKHFEIFRAIKIGRARKATDDEILSAVAGVLTTSYSYSVSGDLYMQIMWRRLRGRMEERALAERLAAPGPESRTRTKGAAPAESRVRAAKAAEPKAAPAKMAPSAPAIPPPPAGDVAPTNIPRGIDLRSRFPAAAAPAAPLASPAEPDRNRNEASEEGSLGLRAASRAATAPVSRTQAPEPRIAAAAEQPTAHAGKPVATAAGRAAAVPAPKPRASAVTSPVAAPPIPEAPARAPLASEPAPGAQSEPSLRPAAKAKGAKLLVRAPSGPEPEGEIRAKHGSISDSIRKLSGRSYDVYREIFLEKVRDHIHRTLLANQTRSHGLFDTAANEAEDQVFGFIQAHYDDPFMDWERSAEREAVEAMGFSLPSLAPIIESCFRKLSRS